MTSTRSPRSRTVQLVFTLVALAAAALALAALRPAAARASDTQLSIMQDDDQLLYSGNATRDKTLQQMKQIGVDYVRVTVLWSVVANNAFNTPARRKRFKPDDPRTYPKLNWDRYDELVKSAQKLHIGVYFDVTGPGPPQYMGHTKDKTIAAAYKPNAKQFYKFVKAVGKRYSGTYRDENYGLTILPAVHFWSLWNEPNQGAWLAPQYVGGKPYSPRLYRELYLRGHQALAETGHGGDVILAGETAPLGSNARGARSPMRPAKFIRELFCVQPNGLPYTGSAASARGCSLFQKFAPQGGWQMTGWAHHPYTKKLAPTQRDPSPDSISFANIGDLGKLLDSIANTTHYIPAGQPVFLTEFGYETSPPDKFSGIPLDIQAAWINLGDEIAYKDPRIASNAQFLFKDQPPLKKYTKGTKKYWFTYQSGLRYANGTAKPAYIAYAFPFNMTPLPPAADGSGQFDAWGQMRFLPNFTTGVSAALQWRPSGSPTWTDVTTIPVTNPAGFFEATVPARGAGSWRALLTNASVTVSSRESSVTY
jgi:hypothetical protein